jgi:hypothetical protein
MRTFASFSHDRSFTGGIMPKAALLGFVVGFISNFPCASLAGPIAWDGRGVDPNSAMLVPKQTRKPARQFYTGAPPSMQTDAPEYSPAWRKMKEARDTAEDKKLKRLISICRGC